MNLQQSIKKTLDKDYLFVAERHFEDTEVVVVAHFHLDKNVVMLPNLILLRFMSIAESL